MNVPDDMDTTADINIVPMIDVIFAILTFFIMSTLFMTRSEGLPVNLPNAETAETQRTEAIVVTIDPSGELSLNRNSVALQDLADQVSQLKGDRDSALVTINADTEVSHGIVVSVMDELRTVEGARLGIATQRSQSQAVQ